MSTSARHRRLQVLAAAIGVGIGVMTGQGIATADPEDTSGSSSSSSSSSSSESSSSSAGESSSESTATESSSTIERETSNNNGTASESNSSSSESHVSGNGLSSSAGSESHVSGNGLSSSSTADESNTAQQQAAETAQSSATETAASETETPELAAPAVETLSTPTESIEPVVPEVVDVAAVETVETAAAETEAAITETDTAVAAEHAAIASQVSAATQEVRTQTESANTRLRVATETSLPSSTPTFDAVTSLLGAPATFPSLDLRLPSVELPMLTTFTGPPVTTSTTAALTTVAPQPRFELDLPDPPDLEATLAPLLAALVLPGLPPLGPNPTPPIPPLSWAFVSLTRRWFNETPEASYTTTGQDANTGVVTGTIEVSDSDTDEHTYTVTKQGEKGHVEVDADGNWTYTPDDPNVTGDPSDDTFEITVSDATDDHIHLGSWFQPGAGHTATVQVGVEIDDLTPNEAPSAVTVADSQTDPVTGTITGHFTATDPEGDDLTFDVGTPPERGVLTVQEDGSFTYVPEPDDRNAPGATATFTVTATDAEGAETTSAIELDIAQVASSTSVTLDGKPAGVLRTTPDGRHVYVVTSGTDAMTGEETTTVTVVDTVTGEHTEPVTIFAAYEGMDMSPDGSRAVLAMSDRDDTIVHVFDTETGQSIASFLTAGDIVHAQFTDDGDHIYVVSQSFSQTGEAYTHHQLVDFDANSGTTFSVPGRLGVVAESPSGDYAFVEIEDEAGSTVYVVDLTTGDHSPVVTTTEDVIYIAASPDGVHAFVLATDYTGTTTVSVIDAENETSTVPATVDGSPVTVVLSQDGSVGYVLTRRSPDIGPTVTDVTAIDATSGQTEHVVTMQGFPWLLTVQDDRFFLVTTNGGVSQLTVIDTATGEHTSPDTFLGIPHTLFVTDDHGAILVTGTSDRNTQVSVIDPTTGQATYTTTVEGIPGGVDLSDDGERITVVTRFGIQTPDAEAHITVLDTATGEQVGETLVVPGELLFDRATGDDRLVVLTTEFVGNGAFANNVVIVDTETGDVVASISSQGTQSRFQFGSDRSTVYIAFTDTDGSTHVNRIDVVTGDQEPIAEYEDATLTDMQTVDIDGTEYLLVETYDAATDTTTVNLIRNPANATENSAALVV